MLCWTLNGEYYMCCTAKSEITSHYETFAFVVGLNDDKTIKKDVVKINLHQWNAITIEEELRLKCRSKQSQPFSIIRCSLPE